MFIELNEVRGFVINVDGFLRLGETPPYRKHLVWSEVIDTNLHEVRILPELPILLGMLHSTFPLAMVSKLRPDHLKKILEGNEVDFPADKQFAANPFDDLEQSIRFSTPIKNARDSLGLASCHCAYLTAEHETISRALSLHLGTILYKYPGRDAFEDTEEWKSGPDLILDSPEHLEKVISKELVGYLGEFHACSERMRHRVSKRGTILLQVSYIPHEDLPNDTQICVTGRYFPKDDYRWVKHPLSIRLINSKRYPERHLDDFGRIIERSANLVTDGNYDLITCVPPKPSQGESRIRQFLEHIPVIVPTFDRSRISPNVLECIREHDPQKSLGSYVDRRRNIHEAYVVKNDVAGKIVVLVDDIFTSGATLCELTSLLLEAGCTKVYPVVIAFTPRSQIQTEAPKITCPGCGLAMEPRMNSKDGHVFFGCTGFKSGCRHTEKFEDQIIKLNERSFEAEDHIRVGDIDIDF